MAVQASEVRELIEQVQGSYGYDYETGERVNLEHGIPEQYAPILSRMEAGGEMTFEEEFWFVEAYSFFVASMNARTSSSSFWTRLKCV